MGRCELRVRGCAHMAVYVYILQLLLRSDALAMAAVVVGSSVAVQPASLRRVQHAVRHTCIMCRV